MKAFRVIVANPNAAQSATFSGMTAACNAFNLALCAATPIQPRDDSRIVRGHLRTLAIGECYAAKGGEYGKDAAYMVTVHRVK